MNALANLIARHPVETLLLAAVMVVLIVALTWLLMRRYREPAWRALNGQGMVEALVRRLPLLRSIERPPAALATLALDLVFGFALVLLAVGAFFQLADEMALDEALGRFDHALASEMAKGVSDSTLRFFAHLTRLADMEVQTAICIAVAVLLFWRGRRLLVLTWIAAIAGNGLLTRTLKWWFARERPLHEHGWVVEHSWSFPSGHASGALAVYGMLAYLLVRATPRVWHLPIVLAAATLVLAIGYSRVLLQVHYLSDVLAGWTLASAWLIVCIATARVIRAHRNPQRG